MRKTHKGSSLPPLTEQEFEEKLLKYRPNVRKGYELIDGKLVPVYYGIRLKTEAEKKS